jgi:tRNA A37 threonylcarbamoyladenosine dehydratase
MSASTISERRFSGIARLYGSASLARLATAHVCVIGIGGVGSWASEALARSGVGRLTLIDLDHVAESNLNRQIHALNSTLGQAKVLAMRERVQQINPQCQVDCREDFITSDNLATLLPDAMVIIDCIDQVKAKAALIAHCRQHTMRIITTGGAGGRIDPTRIRLDDLARTTQDALASKLRARLRKDYAFPRDPKRKFGVPCVYSDEPIRRPASADFSASCTVDGSAGLACAGYGSAVTVTASFGLAAAAHCLDILLK